jgi:type I restriction enzyme S subunit
MPKTEPPSGWRWVALTNVARLESGHTPSRKHPEYWGGGVPWLSIRDAKANHGGVVATTIETTNDLGIENSSARVLPQGTVCLSRTASVGYVTIMGRDMATSQDFVNWVCSDKLEPRFLQYLLICEKPSLSRFSSGAVHQTIYFPEAKAFHICIPSVEEQRRIVAVLDEAFTAIAAATSKAEKNLANAQELFRGAIDKRFACSEWPSHQLVHLTSVFDDGDWVESKDQSPGGIRLIQTGNVGRGLFKDRAEKARYVSEDTFKRLRCTEIFQGDCLVSRLPDPVGRACVIPDTGERMITAVDCTIVRFVPHTLLAELFCYYSLSSSYETQVAKLITGATRLRISRSNLGTVKVPVPPMIDQERLLAELNEIADLVGSFEAVQRQRIATFGRLKQSILHRAFTGDLIAPEATASESANDNFATPEFAAQVLAFAYSRHERQQSQKTFGHVKAQKTLQLVESIGGINLGRHPIKDAAGPNDFRHMLRATDWAAQHGFFEFVPRVSGNGYDFKKLANYGPMMTDALAATRPVSVALERAIDVIVPLVSQDAEVFATVHAAWNNLLHDGKLASEDAIVKEARDDWHRAKLNIPEAKFRAAIKSIRAKGLVPDGTAKYVGGQGGLL